MSKFLLILLVAIVSANLFADTRIFSEEYNNIKRVSLSVSVGCKPPECMVVGLGRSPTAVTDFLNIRLPGSAINFPISEFTYRKPIEVLYGEQHGPVKKLYEHFDNMLIKQLGPGVKRIVLVDYCDKGGSLYSMDINLRYYLKKRGIKIKVKSVGIVAGGVMAKLKVRGNRRLFEGAKSLKILSVKRKGVMGTKLYNGMYEAVAEYGKQNLEYGIESFRNRSSVRSEYLKSLEGHISRDKTLGSAGATRCLWDIFKG